MGTDHDSIGSGEGTSFLSRCRLGFPGFVLPFVPFCSRFRLYYGYGSSSCVSWDYELGCCACFDKKTSSFVAVLTRAVVN